MGWTACNLLRRQKYIHISVYLKIIHRMIPIGQKILSSYTIEFLPHNWGGVGLLNILFIKQ
jgi:hypothetical protein